MFEYTTFDGNKTSICLGRPMLKQLSIQYCLSHYIIKHRIWYRFADWNFFHVTCMKNKYNTFKLFLISY